MPTTKKKTENLDILSSNEHPHVLKPFITLKLIKKKHDIPLPTYAFLFLFYALVTQSTQQTSP